MFLFQVNCLKNNIFGMTILYDEVEKYQLFSKYVIFDIFKINKYKRSQSKKSIFANRVRII